MVGVNSFIPSPALQQQAVVLSQRKVAEALKRVDAMMKGKQMNALADAQSNFVAMLKGGTAANNDGLDGIVDLIREVADSNTAQLKKRVITSDITTTLEDAQAWCNKMRGTYDSMNDIIDEAATNMASHIADQSPANREKMLKKIAFLDEALGYFTQVNQFSTALLKEIAAHSSISPLLTKPAPTRRNREDGGGPMSL